MTVLEAYNKAVETCVGCGDSGVYYLEPLWRLDPTVAEFVDNPAAMEEIKEMLELTVAKKNAESDLIHPVVNWLYQLMTDEGAAVMNNSEIKLVEDMMEYLRQNPEGTKRRPDLKGWNFAMK